MAKNPNKTYTVVKVEDGIEHRLYSDGTMRKQNGHLISLPPHLEAHKIQDTETSEYMRKRRKQKILEAIEAKVQNITKTQAPADAIGAIVGKRAEIAMRDKTRTGNDAAKIVLSAMDAYQDKADVRTNVLRNEYVIDEGTRALLERIAQARNYRTNVLDADETE